MVKKSHIVGKQYLPLQVIWAVRKHEQNVTSVSLFIYFREQFFQVPATFSAAVSAGEKASAPAISRESTSFGIIGSLVFSEMPWGFTYCIITDTEICSMGAICIPLFMSQLGRAELLITRPYALHLGVLLFVGFIIY